MSTFDGIVAEFPDIRVDFFRKHATLPPPLACFLSHIHSDHLAGLDSLRSPFVYCSAATREMLLRLEKYPCRINFAQGILEARVQTYRHLKKVLKALPLDTTTELELAPGNRIRVTLFDANHCPGSVMFLFEGVNQAVLYTGDTRSEPWFVNSLARNPCLVEYSSGLKTLDKLYLDTSFLDDIHFQTKAEGLRELLQQVSRYPQDTVFHFQAWTFGYEEVWVALSRALKSKIHVDKYKLDLYKALTVKDSVNRFGSQHHMSAEAPSLVGFMCANTAHDGCLTDDVTVRLHSCERGNFCSTVKNSRVVSIQPIVCRLPDGHNIAEAGVGGGGEDLEREAELEFLAAEDIEELFKIICTNEDIPGELKEHIQSVILNTTAHGRTVSLDLDISSFGPDQETNISNAVKSMANRTRSMQRVEQGDKGSQRELLPKTITFPYSRHSSYPELCHLVMEFRPKDIWPCTVSPQEWHRNNTTIQSLFGQYCSSDVFNHDVMMTAKLGKKAPSAVNDNSSQLTSVSESRDDFEATERRGLARSPPDEEEVGVAGQSSPPRGSSTPTTSRQQQLQPQKRSFDDYQGLTDPSGHIGPDEEFSQQSWVSTLTDRGREAQRNSWDAMISNARGDEWTPIGLLSTSANHSIPEPEFGSD